VTVALLLTMPPAPVHVRVYVVVAAGVTVAFPVRSFAPLQPPDAVQLCASNAFHDRKDGLPAVMEFGVAIIATTGGVVVEDGPVFVGDAADRPPPPQPVAAIAVATDRSGALMRSRNLCMAVPRERGK
jgi:hypothetical protein